HVEYLRARTVPADVGDLRRLPGHDRWARRRWLSSRAGGDGVDHRLRRRAVAARLDELGVDGLLVTSLVNTRYLTGFTGSNGQLLLGVATELFLTDGRYAMSSRRAVPDLERFSADRSYRGAVADRCAGASIARLGIEAGAMTVADHDALAAALGEGVELVALQGVVEEQRRVK